jgi:hypothetical protein
MKPFIRKIYPRLLSISSLRKQSDATYASYPMPQGSDGRKSSIKNLSWAPTSNSLHLDLGQPAFRDAEMIESMPYWSGGGIFAPGNSTINRIWSPEPGLGHDPGWKIPRWQESGNVDRERDGGIGRLGSITKTVSLDMSEHTNSKE